MRKIIGVSLLILLLTNSAGAGIMPNESPTPPPSQPISAVDEPTADGVMGNGSATSLVQVALELFAVLPSLL